MSGGEPEKSAVPSVSDFREVGLSQADAQAAASGLAEGRYLSFEDACLSRAIFGGGSKAVTLDEAAMRERARTFTGSPAGARKITVEDLDEALGLSGARGGTGDGGLSPVLEEGGSGATGVVAGFREAGFSEDQARRGAQMMASGRYAGFADVAESLRCVDGNLFAGRFGAGGKLVAPTVKDYKIAEVAARLDALRKKA